MSPATDVLLVDPGASGGHLSVLSNASPPAAENAAQRIRRVFGVGS